MRIFRCSWLFVLVSICGLWAFAKSPSIPLTVPVRSVAVDGTFISTAQGTVLPKGTLPNQRESLLLLPAHALYGTTRAEYQGVDGRWHAVQTVVAESASDDLALLALDTPPQKARRCHFLSAGSTPDLPAQVAGMEQSGTLRSGDYLWSVRSLYRIPEISRVAPADAGRLVTTPNGEVVGMLTLGDTDGLPVVVPAAAILALTPTSSCTWNAWANAHSQPWLTTVAGQRFRCRAQLTLGQLAAAQDGLSALHIQHPTNAAVAVDLGEVLLHRGFPGAATPLLRTALQQNPNDVRTLTCLGMANCLALRYQHAVPFLEQAVQHDPTNALAHAALARAMILNEKYTLALPVVQHALTLDPNNLYAHITRAYLAGNMQQSHIEKDEFAYAMTHAQTSIEGLCDLAWASMETTRYSQCLTLLQQVDTLDPRNALGALYRGNLLYQLGCYEQAVTPLSRAKQADPDDATSHLLLALVYTSLQRHDEAATEVAWATQTAPDLAENFRHLVATVKKYPGHKVTVQWKGGTPL